MNSTTLRIAVEVDDKGSVKIRQVGDAAEAAARKGSTGFGVMGKSIAQADRSASLLSTTAKGLVASLGAAAAIGAAAWAIDLADSYAQADGRLRLVTESSAELAGVQRELYAQSQRTMSGYLGNVDVYARFAQSTQDLHLSQADLLTVTETLNKAFAISGSSQAETSATMVQLSQALSSGVLRGEEFNSVSEQGGRVMQLLADYTGKSRGELRGMAEDGQLTADVLIRAILSGAGDVNAEFGEMPLTVSRAGTMLMNTLGGIVSEANEATGATRGIAGAIAGIATAIDAHKEGIFSFFREFREAAASATSGAEMMAEAGAMAIDKPIESAVRKVPGIKASIKELEAEIARINANPGLKAIKAENGDLSALNVQLERQKRLLKELTSSPVVTGEAGGKIDIVAQAFGRVSFQMQGVKAQSESTMKITDEMRKTFLKYTQTAEQGIEAEKAAAMAGAKSAEERFLVEQKYQKDLANLKKQGAHESAAATKKQAEAYQQLIDKYLPLKAEQAEYNEVIGQFDEMLQKHIITQEEYTEGVRNAAEALRVNKERTQELEEAQRMLADWQKEYDQALMSDSERRIDDIVRETNAIIDQTNQLVRLGQISREVGDAANAAFGERARRRIEELSAASGTMGRMFEDVAKNIQDAFAGLFENMLDGSGDFLDQLWSMFKRLIAQMATMAIANPIIVPVVTSVGTAMGVSNSAIASTLGVSTSQVSGLSGLSGLAGMFSSGSLGTMGVSGLTGIADMAYFLGIDSVGNIAIDAASWLNGLSGGLADGLTAGVGSLAMSLLSGQGLTASTGLQAAGSVLGGILGFGAPGAIIGGFLGNMLGGLFGDNGPDTFRWSPAAEIHASDWATNAGGLTLSDYEWTRTDTDGQLYKVFGQQIESIQSAFNDQVKKIADAMPDVLADAMLAELEDADLSGLLTSTSLGEFEVSKASDSLKAIAEKYSSGLVEALGEAYATALGEYIDTNGAAGLVGNSQVWNMLTSAARADIDSAFSEAAGALQAGDFESGLSTLSNISSVISSISAAMEPITEILETSGLSDYEKQVRAVNKQFDAYAEALEAAGVDLSRYTELEKARALALEQIVDPAVQEALDAERALAEARKETAKAALDLAEEGLRRSFDAERGRVDEQYDAMTSQINGQLDLAHTTLSGLQSLSGSLESAIAGMSNIQTADSSYSSARGALAAALKAARIGDMTLASALGEGNTLAALQQRGQDAYATAVEYQRDYWTTYLSLVELKGLTDGQVTEAEQSVALLERQLTAAEEWYGSAIEALDNQLNAILGVDTSVEALSVAIRDYVAALEEDAMAQAALERVSGSYATGIDYVPRTMVARIHEGERVVPANQNRSDSTNAEIVAILRQVVVEVRATGVANAKASAKMADILDAWDGEGMPEQRAVA